MRKIVKLLLFVVVLLGLVTCIDKWGYYLFQWKYKGPQEFYNIAFTVPSGAFFHVHEEMINFFLWQDQESFLVIGRMRDSEITSLFVSDYYKRQGYRVIEVKPTFFKGHKGFLTLFVDDSWRYNEKIWIPSEKITIHLGGMKKDYDKCKQILDSIEFR